MSESKKVTALLRAFATEAALEAELQTARISESELVASLKSRAQQELADEQELMLIEHAASLAIALSKIARQTSEMEAAALLSTHRQDFIATVTHDLKSPLSGANRIFDLFENDMIGSLTQEQKEILRQMKASNERSLDLLRTLNDVYRFESAPGAIQLERCGLDEIVKESFKNMQSENLHRKIRTSLAVSQNMEPIELDPVAIQRLMDNLLNNAVKFTSEEGHVQVRVFQEPGEAIVEVQNDGEEISEEERKSLFQRFAQGNLGRRYSRGTGLGLYLCKQIAQAHGGVIENKVVAHGALFRLTLPILAENLAAPHC